MCGDESDLAWCRKQERTEEECPDGYTRCNSTLGMPGQCILTSKAGDRKYQCLDRSDRNPYRQDSDQHST